MMCLCRMICMGIIHRDLGISSIRKYLKDMAIKQNERYEINENLLPNNIWNYRELKCKVRRLKLALT